MNNIDVVCIGAMVIDLPLGPIDEKRIFNVESTVVDNILLTTGGDALNEAVIISRLGHSVSLIGQIGNDMLGDIIIKRCEDDQIQHNSIIRDSNISTRINVVIIKENGERHFIKDMNATSGSLRDEHIDYEIIKKAKVVSLASIFASKLTNNKLILKILKTAKENNVTTFADMVPMSNGETLDFLAESLPYLDYFLPNLEEAKMLTGETTPDNMANRLLDYGVKNVIIKSGKRGCFLKNKDKSLLVPGFQVNAVDTTGAGDNFVAGFITAFLDGRKIEECGRYANAVAALSTEQVGAITAVKNRQQIDEKILSAN